jgi:hypothetical protein
MGDLLGKKREEGKRSLRIALYLSRVSLAPLLLPSRARRFLLCFLIILLPELAAARRPG